MKAIVVTILSVLLLAAPLEAKEFRFAYEEGSRYKIHSRVDEVVYINDLYSHRADILNKISIEIADSEDGAGFIEATFLTSERSFDSNSVYEWSREYYSQFWRDELGEYEIAESYFMPVVRGVPKFPQRDLEPGDTWTAPGSEVHDFRDNFSIPEAFHFPIQVNYTYVGEAEFEGRTLDRIDIAYTVFYKENRAYRYGMYPIRITGFSEQQLYWDHAAGRPHHYSEDFDFIFTFNTGDTVEYIGEAEATVHTSVAMDKEKVAGEIRDRLADSKVENTEVSVDDQGVTVSIEDIRFLPDSSELIPSEIEKLKIIAEILTGYPDRDFLITGHTAMAGTAEGRQALSEERAKAVGNYLLRLGAGDAGQIVTKGMGGRKPIADNSTEEGMRRNRRVEITILEN